jgi:hypothetical protein
MLNDGSDTPTDPATCWATLAGVGEAPDELPPEQHPPDELPPEQLPPDELPPLPAGLPELSAGVAGVVSTSQEHWLVVQPHARLILGGESRGTGKLEGSLPGGIPGTAMIAPHTVVQVARPRPASPQTTGSIQPKPGLLENISPIDHHGCTLKEIPKVRRVISKLQDSQILRDPPRPVKSPLRKNPETPGPVTDARHVLGEGDCPIYPS